ncbi:DinB family protein [Solicola gregarius]|uniref:DinB family protein n=1 Tax=Solicola gregarius TaxID=2908642 RepID=A0AA46TIN5_9ACTN|nr:DinB family protein [Solicola gregarius]UYM06054.1 DinB family protein [Solicola gregarius]
MAERKHPDMWVEPEDDPRVDETPDSEIANLVQYLRRYRQTFEMKCDGLDAEQLARRSVPPSTMSLLGLVRHLARVEHSWFHRVLQGHADEPKLFNPPDDPDIAFTGAVADPAVVDEAWSVWREQVAAADGWLGTVGDDDMARAVDVDGEPAPIRDILLHMVEEYARHCGHADLLREAIDGRTGQ